MLGREIDNGENPVWSPGGRPEGNGNMLFAGNLQLVFDLRLASRAA
jgi:hypothetical protein